jgi:hypothetical protein
MGADGEESSLVLVEDVTPKRLSTADRRRIARWYATPVGVVETWTRIPHTVIEGSEIPSGWVDSAGFRPLPKIMDPYRGELGGQPFTITRPRLGFRVRDRACYLTFGEATYHSVWHSRRRFDIVGGDRVLLRAVKNRWYLAEGMSATEAACVLLFFHSGAVQRSTFGSYISI